MRQPSPLLTDWLTDCWPELELAAQVQQRGSVCGASIFMSRAQWARPPLSHYEDNHTLKAPSGTDDDVVENKEWGTVSDLQGVLIIISHDHDHKPKHKGSIYTSWYLLTSCLSGIQHSPQIMLLLLLLLLLFLFFFYRIQIYVRLKGGF